MCRILSWVTIVFILGTPGTFELLSPATCAGSDSAPSWPTRRHDDRRSGVTESQLPATRLQLAWQWQSPSSPRTAWPGPAKWDAYANLRDLMWMRDYDAAFHPIIVGDRVYWTSSVDDQLRCASLATGRILWQYTVDAPFRTPPTWHNGRIYAGSDDGLLRCFDAETGKLLWQFQPPEARDQEWIIHNGRLISRWPCRTDVVVHNGTVYAGFALLPWQPAFLCALDAQTGQPTGSGRYVVQLDGDTLEGPMAYSQETIIACRGRIEPALFHAQTGRRSGRLTGGGGSFLTVDQQGLLWHGPGNKTGWLTASQLPNGKKVASRKGAECAVFAGNLAIFGDHGRVVARRRDGQIAWERSLPGVCELIVAGDHVIGGGNDRIAIWSLRDGKLLWHTTVPGRARSLAVASQRLVVATDTGAVLCFASTPGERKPSGSKSDLPKPQETEDAPRDTSASLRTAKGNDDANEGEAKRAPASSNEARPVHLWDFRKDMARFAIRRGLPDAEALVPDSAGSLRGKWHGQRTIWQAAGIQAGQFDGNSYVELTSRTQPPPFPVEALTAEAWVAVERPLPWGGIVGLIRDNGADEQGWLLGFRDRHFTFAVRSTRGNGKLTYLPSPEPFQAGQWYHVVGTYDGRHQRLYVNGKLVAQSETQRGPIQYPPTGVAVIGAYKDENEDFRLTGMIDRVAVFDRALSEREIVGRFEARRRLYPRPVELAVGPWVRFPSPTSAQIEWETSEPRKGRVRLARASGDEEVRNIDHSAGRHTVLLKDLRPGERLEYTIELEGPEGMEISGPYSIDLAFNYRLPHADTRRVGEEDRRWAETVRSMADFHGGLIAVVGPLKDTRLIALAETPRTFVRQLLPEPSAANEARRVCADVAGYGVRFSVRSLDSKSWHRWPRDTANLVLVTRREPLSSEQVTHLCHWVQPGGILLVPTGSESPLASRSSSRVELGGQAYWLWRRPLPSGTGVWSHLYADSDNTGFTGETLQGASRVDALRARWIGLPGPGAQADRSGRKPSPLAVSGRLFVQGLDRIVALDAYNGVILWELEVPHWARFNMPRDCSNWCADDRYLFLAVRDRCWVIDQVDGSIVRRDRVRVPRAGEGRWAWGYVGRSGKYLLGTTVAADGPFREYWGGFGWYDARGGEETAKVCADRLFALDAETGKLAWEYERGVVVQASLTARDGRVYFVESTDEKIKAGRLRRLNDDRFWQSARLVALRLEDGQVAWDRTLESPPGRVAFLMSAGPKQLITVASDAGLFHVRAWDSSNGQALWQATAEWPGGKKGDHGKALSRPAIVGDKVFVRPAVFALEDGKKLSMTLPYGKCGTFSCAADMFFYRHTIVSAWSPGSGQLHGWKRLRPDCWLSTIPALGMVLSPEAGGGCSCGYWYEASLGFSPQAGLPLESNQPQQEDSQQPSP